MEETKMNAAITSASDQLHPSHRYQVYRQQRAGYYTIGLQTDTAADAVQAFLDTRPAFEGGTIRLWDRSADLLMAAAEWDIGAPTRLKTPKDAIVNVRTWKENRLDLLPSTLELAWSLKQPSQKEHLLRKFLAKVEKDYDLILIDCAPTESVLTTAAYLASQYILIPVKPEYLSTIGLPLLNRSLQEFHKYNEEKKVEVLGIVFNHSTQYHPEESLSKDEVRTEAKAYGWDIFASEISYSRSYPKGAREGEPIFRTSHSRKKQIARLAAFAKEFGAKLGL